MRIDDGTGKGYEVKVTESNRLCTSSVTTSNIDAAACLGNRYNLNTGDITLTDANKTTTIYLKNNEDNDLVISSFIYNLGNSTSGTGDGLVEILRNPTTGDIVTNANNVAINSNQHFGSSNTLSADVYLGATSEAAITDGSVSISTRLPSPAGRTLIVLGALILPKGASLAIDYTPPASNTSQICQFAISCFLFVPGN